MFQELVKRYFQKLKIILQFKYLFLIIFFCSLLWVFINYFKIEKSSLNINKNYIEGQVIDYLIINDKIKITLKSTEKVIVYIDNNLDIKYGDYLYLEGEFKEFESNRVFNNFNYKKYNYHKKTYYKFYANKIKKSTSKNIYFLLKNKIFSRINNLNNCYINSLIINDKSLLDKEINNSFKINGVTHIFAISGMHLSYITLILEKVLKKIKYKKIIITNILLFYLVLLNIPVSLLRSIIFYILKNLLKKYKISLINILLLTYSILLFFNYHFFYDIGVQYSFFTILGIFLLRKNNRDTYLISLFKISIVSFLFSLPITLMYFYEFNLLSIINNVIFIPLISFIIYPLCLIVVFFNFLNPILNYIIILFEKINLLMSQISIMVIIPKVNIIFYIIYYIFLIFIFIYHKYKLTSILIITIFILKFKPFIDNRSYVYFIDVGQGDSTLIIDKYAKDVILIDTGGNEYYHPTDAIITLLKSLGINKIDLLVLTHGDFDHIGDALYFLDNFKVQNIIINKGETNDLENNIIKKYNKKIIYNLKSYNNFKLIDTSIYNNENDNSIICTYKDFVFMGDASKLVEKSLDLKQFKIIKLGHHGSKTSSGYDFLKSLNPYLAIVSSGKNNIYNHPSKETIVTLNNLSINYLNTANAKTIKIIIKDKNYYIELLDD